MLMLCHRRICSSRLLAATIGRKTASPCLSSTLPSQQFDRHHDAICTRQPLQLPRLIPGAATIRSYTDNSRTKPARKIHLPKTLNPGYLNVNEYNSLHELLQTAIGRLGNISHSGIAAVWSKIPRLLSRHHDMEELNLKQCEFEISALLEHTMESMGRFGSKDLATVTLGMAKIVKSVKGGDATRFNVYQQALHKVLLDVDVSDNSSIFRTLAKEANVNMDRFKPRELSNLAYAYALLGHDPILFDDHNLFENIAIKAAQCLRRFNAQDFSNLIWSFAKLNVEPPNNFYDKAGLFISKSADLDTFKPQEISNILYSLAIANVSCKELFQRFGGHICKMNDLDAFNQQELSNIVWAYAKLGTYHDDLFYKVGCTIEALDMSRFTPQTFSNLLWAYATIDEQSSSTVKLQRASLFGEMGDVMARVTDWSSFKPQALSNIIWAYATVNIEHAHIFNKVEEAILKRNDLGSFKPQHVSNIVWGYASAKMQHPELFDMVGDEMAARSDLQSFKAQELSIVLWAFATAKIDHGRMFAKVGDAIIDREDLSTSFNWQNISNTIWAYAKSNTSYPSLFDKIEDSIIHKLDLDFTATSEHLVKIVLSYAKANQIRSDLFQKIGKLIIEAHSLQDFSSQALANVAWAYAVANMDESKLFNDKFLEILLAKEDKFIRKTRIQLYQWHLWQSKEKSNYGLPESMQNDCYQAFVSSQTNPSGLQEDVVVELYGAGIGPVVQEYLTPSGYRIDALVEVNGKKIGIEVDGPSHFIGNKVDGSTALKRRQVTNVDGIEVVSISYLTWNEFWNDSSRKQNYLRSLVK